MGTRLGESPTDVGIASNRDTLLYSVMNDVELITKSHDTFGAYVKLDLVPLLRSESVIVTLLISYSQGRCVSQTLLYTDLAVELEQIILGGIRVGG